MAHYITDADGNLIKVAGGAGYNANAVDMPSNTYEALTATANGTYTAPANGWYCANGQSSSTATVHSYITLSTQNGMTTRAQIYGTPSVGLRCFIPVKKGDVVTLGYESNRVSFSYFRFYYAEGEV